jgi:Domain of unknown function (DUF4157)
MLHAFTGKRKRGNGGRSASQTSANSSGPRFTGSPELSSGAGGGVLQRKCECGGSGGAQAECAECKKKEEAGLQRSRAGGAEPPSAVPPIVHKVLQSPGQPLDPRTRKFMEPRFGQDFSNVRIHNDERATKSAQAVNALAYTVGRDIVFARGAYFPDTKPGQYLLAHELTHVVQQSAIGKPQPKTIGPEGDACERQAETAPARAVEGGAVPGVGPANASALQRTPARKVSCAPGPLHLPGGGQIDDPVAVITAAENRANQLLDQAIVELDFTIQQIRSGAAIAWPTISDALAQGLQLMGLDPNSARVWKESGGVGNYTAALLLRRLRLIRGTIGAGSFFFTCRGPQHGTIGPCAGDICANANAVSCAGSFLIDLCEGFWTEDTDFQAGTILHESAHNFAQFIGAHGEVGRGSDIAECYARFAQIVGGTDLGGQRPDLCPDPP